MNLCEESYYVDTGTAYNPCSSNAFNGCEGSIFYCFVMNMKIYCISDKWADKKKSDSIQMFFKIYFSYFQYNDVDDQPDEFLIDLIARYGQTIMNARNDLEK